MRPLSIVVANKDAANAGYLAAQLSLQFRAVESVTSLQDLEKTIRTRRPDVVVVDLELTSLNEVEQLHFQNGRTLFVCTHRLPDEAMWAAALEAGAVDVCHHTDVKAIVLATQRHPVTAARAAARSAVGAA